MQKKFLGALGMALLLMTGTMAMPVQVCAKDYQDREAILDTGFILDTDYTLQLANPSEDISTTESYYYITGSSDPDDPLTCNGEEVADRGIYGSFGIYASLEMGENEFVFENGEDTVSLTITRTEPSTSGGGIATITKQGLAVCYIMECPSILVEAGFVNNPNEYERLSGDAEMSRQAAAIADGVVNFFATH